MRDHNSMRSFCKGVPVIRSLLALLKFRRVCHRWLFQFLIMWASSKIRYFHFFLRNILASCIELPVFAGGWYYFCCTCSSSRVNIVLPTFAMLLFLHVM